MKKIIINIDKLIVPDAEVNKNDMQEELLEMFGKIAFSFSDSLLDNTFSVNEKLNQSDKKLLTHAFVLKDQALFEDIINCFIKRGISSSAIKEFVTEFENKKISFGRER